MSSFKVHKDYKLLNLNITRRKLFKNAIPSESHTIQEEIQFDPGQHPQEQYQVQAKEKSHQEVYATQQTLRAGNTSCDPR